MVAAASVRPWAGGSAREAGGGGSSRWSGRAAARPIPGRYQPRRLARICQFARCGTHAGPSDRRVPRRERAVCRSGGVAAAGAGNRSRGRWRRCGRICCPCPPLGRWLGSDHGGAGTRGGGPGAGDQGKDAWPHACGFAVRRPRFPPRTQSGGFSGPQPPVPCFFVAWNNARPGVRTLRWSREGRRARGVPLPGENCLTIARNCRKISGLGTFSRTLPQHPFRPFSAAGVEAVRRRPSTTGSTLCGQSGAWGRGGSGWR